jgi:hypothetical protein
MSCGLVAARGSDFLANYVFPEGFDFTGYNGAMVIYDEKGGTPLFSVLMTPSSFGSIMTFAANVATVFIDYRDIDASLPVNPDDPTLPAVLWFDLLLLTPGGVQTKIQGGAFKVLPTGAALCPEAEQINVSLDGVEYVVNIIGGPSFNIDVEASAFGASLVQAGDATEARSILGVYSIAETDALLGDKADIDFGNVDPITGRDALGVDFRTPEDFGAVGDNTGDYTAELTAWFNCGHPLKLPYPASAYRAAGPIIITAPVWMTSDDLGTNDWPIFVHSGTDALFKFRTSNVTMNGFQVWCEAGSKATADTAPTFMWDTANIAGATISNFRLSNFYLKWTGGMFYDSGGAGAFQNVQISNGRSLLQRGRMYKLTRAFASIYTEGCYFDKSRAGGLFGGETLAEFNYPMVEIDTPAIAGAGGYIFEKQTSFAGSSYPTATSDYGFYIGHGGAGGGGIRLKEVDVDNSAADAFNALFQDELEINDCRFSAVLGNGVVLDQCTEVIGVGNRFDGTGANAKYAVWVKGTNNRNVTLEGLQTGFAAPLRKEGTGHTNIQVSLDGAGQAGGGEQITNGFWPINFGSAAPADAVLTANIRGNVTGATGTWGRVGFGSVTLLDTVYVRNVLRCDITNTSGTGPYLDVTIQPLELLSDQWITLEFIGYDAGAGGSYNVTPQTVQKFGSGGSPSADVTTSAEVLAFTTTPKQFAVAVYSPSVSGKTFGTTVSSDTLRVRLLFPAAKVCQPQFSAMACRVGSRVIPIQLAGNGGFTYS